MMKRRVFIRLENVNFALPSGGWPDFWVSLVLLVAVLLYYAWILAWWL